MTFTDSRPGPRCPREHKAGASWALDRYSDGSGFVCPGLAPDGSGCGYRIVGGTAETAADAFEDAAAGLVQHLTDLAASPLPHGLDPRAILLGLSRGLGSSKEAAEQLARQGWFDADDPEVSGRWQQTLASLAEISALFEEIANGWI